MFTITKQFSFSASHQLYNLPDDHPCSRLHGHNYIVEIELQSSGLNEAGFVVDYGDLRRLKRYIDSTLDHRHLNDVTQESPTAEWLAFHLFQYSIDLWPETSAVRISETPKTWAEYRSEPKRLEDFLWPNNSDGEDDIPGQ